MQDGSATSLARRISARMPQTHAVSPALTTALPLQWLRELVLITGLRKVDGERPFARICDFEDRCARRKGEGERVAKRAGGKESASGGAEAAGIV